MGLTTLGCKVAQYETEALAEAFLREGFLVGSFEDVCDVYVINTCTVTGESDRKSRQIIRRACRKNPHAVVMVTGCYAQSDANAVAAIEGVSYVAGNEAKMQIPHRARLLLEQQTGEVLCECLDVERAAFEPMCIRQAPRTRAYVKIEDGCDCFCTYCAIPAARGHVRSKRPDHIVEEVTALAAGGTCEVVLTGIETAAYGTDLEGCSLVELLELLERADAPQRIRLGSMPPEFFKPTTVERLAKLTRLTPHFHMSIQSGSSGVLARMKRRYNATQAMANIRALRAAIPHLELTADVIVGFPGETEEEFAETEEFLRQAEFLDVHVFAYSPRSGTPAASFSAQVPEAVKKARSKRLMSIARDTRLQRLEKAAQFPVLSVLFEQWEGDLFVGHTASFIPVYVKTELPLHGKICNVGELFTENGRLMGSLLNS